MNIFEKNQTYTALIESYSSDGSGVCHIDGRAIFVPRTLVGEEWIIKILKVTSGAIYARGEELLRTSASRVSPECPYFGKCGGCVGWHMTYEEELRFKLQKVNDALTRIGRQTVTADRIIGSECYTAYRNKAIFAVAEADAMPCTGFFRERSHQLIPVERCLIQSDIANRAAKAVEAFMRKENIPAYNEETGKGTVRHVYCRTSDHEKGAVLCLVAARGLGSKTERFVSNMKEAIPELTGIVLNVNKTRGNTVLAGDFYTLWGSADIKDSLLGVKYTISPQAFFQINPPQAEKLYSLAVEYALPSRGGLVFDLYCGAGTISLCLAARADTVIGAEVVPQAIENAKHNAEMNGIANAEFICGDAGEAAEALAARGLHPEAIVVDPPRKGMSEEAVRAVASMKPERIAYVSCDPATLARDVLLFSELGYELKCATAVDMFPRTAHVETVVLMSRARK